MLYKGICKKILKLANSRLEESVLYLDRAKIGLVEFKAVYSKHISSCSLASGF